MEIKKILMLTLGAGRITEDKSAGYFQTQYIIEGISYQKNGRDSLTNFVAEPLIDFFEPDDIIIMGTVKSMWHTLYASLTTDDNTDMSYLEDENYKRLYEIVSANGVSTSSEDLEKLREEITGIFSRIKTWEKYSEKYKNRFPNVYVLLTKYGINKEELEENYGLLKQIESLLSEEFAYEVAFDITHSFRSLPIYNLIIFNYIKNITRFKLTISHIYYGNVDIKRELDGKAPIVDLGELSKILDLTSGVAEFKDTGNAVSLLPLIETDADLKEKLELFDLATQLNAFGKIREILPELILAVEKDDEKNTRYTGVREMVRTVLDEKFFECGNYSGSSLEDTKDADLKYMLTMWFFNQNRIGLGLATGLEALRDINTKAFINANGFNKGGERQYRESAEGYFITIAERLSKKAANERSELEEAVFRLGSKLRDYKNIRNIFAHSLNSDKNVDLKHIRSAVKTFKEELRTLKELYEKNTKTYEELFVSGRGSAHKAAASDSKCRIIIDYSGKCDYSEYKASTSGNRYEVFYLSQNVRKLLLGNLTAKQYPLTERAYFLMRYIQKQMPQGFSATHIILYDCTDPEKEMVFRAFLENIEDQDTKPNLFHNENKELKACRKVGLHISLQEHIAELEEKEAAYVACMDTGFVKA